MQRVTQKQCNKLQGLCVYKDEKDAKETKPQLTGELHKHQKQVWYDEQNMQIHSDPHFFFQMTFAQVKYLQPFRQ